MKKIFYLLIAAVACVRCDVMDTTDQEIYTPEVVWNDKTLAMQYINEQYIQCVANFACAIGETYEGKQLEGGQQGRVGCTWDTTTDNLIYGGSNVAVTNGTINNGFNAGWNIFSQVRGANMIIENCKKATAFAEDVKQNYIAHGRFLRGLVYLRHARMFGGAILIDKVLKPSDDLLLPRNTIKETYDFIIDDFLAAAEHIKSTSNVMGDKATAYGFAVEAALQAASYVNNGNDQEYYYNIALDASEKCLAASTMSMDSDYYNMFNKFGSPDALKEVSFARVLSSQRYKYQDTSSYVICPFYSNARNKYKEVPIPALPTVLVVGQTILSASQDLYDTYQVVDTDGVAKKWNETSYYDKYMAEGGYTSDVLIKHRDKRFYASIITDSCLYGAHKDLIYTRRGGAGHYENSTDPKGKKMGLYMVRKSSHDQYCCKWAGAADYHQVLFRLGRAYLNHAEVLLRLGRTAEAIDFINGVRVPHGGLPALDKGLSAEEAWEAYCYERRVDLFYECDDRYWSLLRWAKLGDEAALAALNINLDKMKDILEDGKTWEEIDTPYSFTKFPDHIWDEKLFAFPIPQSQIDLADGVIKQNPFWDPSITEFY